MGESSPKPSGYKEYVAGLLAGVATVVIGHPFDTVKVKLQKHNAEVRGIKYRNGLHCTARILATEGVRGLHTGATSSFIGVAFESSLVFGIYSQTKKLLQGGVQSSALQPQVIIPSAALVVLLSVLFCVHQRWLPSVGCKFKALTLWFRSPVAMVTGIFRGGSTTLLRGSIGNAVFFSVYEYVRYCMYLQLNTGSSNHSNLTDMGIGILTGGLGAVAFWSAVLPLDVAKTIIQTTPDKSSPTNPFQVLNSIYRRAGLRGCYAGLGPTIVRAFSANAAAIVTWELAMKLLRIKNV